MIDRQRLKADAPRPAEGRGRAFFARLTVGKNTDPETTQARRFFFCERQRTDLSAVSAVFFGLSAVRLQTEKPLHINKLEAFFRLSAVSAVFFARKPKGQDASPHFHHSQNRRRAGFRGHSSRHINGATP
jgi:hypothetical protein